MIRRPRTGDLHRETFVGQIAPKLLARGLKCADLRRFQQKRAIPNHVVRTVRERAWQRTKRLPVIGGLGQIIPHRRSRSLDRGVVMPAPFSTLR